MPQWGALFIDRYRDDRSRLRENSADRTFFVRGGQRWTGFLMLSLRLRGVRCPMLVGVAVVMAAGRSMPGVMSTVAPTRLQRGQAMVVHAPQHHASEQIARQGEAGSQAMNP